MQDRVVNVVMRDGNRTVNWDFKESTTVRECLTRWKFEWEPNSVFVCGEPAFENQLDKPIKDFMYAPSEIYEYANRVFIVMKQPVVEKKRESDADVC